MGFFDRIKKALKVGTDVAAKQPDQDVKIAPEKVAPKKEAVVAPEPETIKAEPKIEPKIEPKAEPELRVEPKKQELKKEALSQKVTSILRRKKETAAVAKAGQTAGAKKRVAAGQVLIRPLVTEKATLTETYIFEIQPTANKTEVAKAIEQIYGIKPVNVRIINMLGKVVRWQYRAGQRKSWKKAIVRLPKGKTIDVYEGT